MCIDSDEAGPLSKSDHNSKLRIHMQHLERQFGRNTVKDFSNSYFSEPIIKPLVLKANFSDVNFDAQYIPSLVQDSSEEVQKFLLMKLSVSMIDLHSRWPMLYLKYK